MLDSIKQDSRGATSWRLVVLICHVEESHNPRYRYNLGSKKDKKEILFLLGTALVIACFPIAYALIARLIVYILQNENVKPKLVSECL